MFNLKGFIISFETIFSILLFLLIILTINFPDQDNFKDLLLLQQENDLLKVWSANYPTNQEIVTDTMLMFDHVSVFLDEKEILKSNGNQSISSEAVILDNSLNEHKFRIVVYFN